MLRRIDELEKTDDAAELGADDTPVLRGIEDAAELGTAELADVALK